LPSLFSDRLSGETAQRSVSVAARADVAQKQPHPQHHFTGGVPPFYCIFAGKTNPNLAPPQQKPCLGRPLQTACWAGTNFADPKNYRRHRSQKTPPTLTAIIGPL
jgi:hypothetical protein